ncbi:MAG: DNA mismatch repair endonuclease MutL [Planctomycetales bacterium]|nr:DNA mismatch repair endonuclease MutL [Planctomycetales bacterium]
MPRIQQLNSHVVNKIAAGEVIERPASVVKELLENSVDALASRIEVDVAEGGSELIRIVDDGEGIHPEDLLLAVTSHATSKIRSAEDLFSVHTLGFRGEALASIAEVSRFRLRSRTADASEAWELEVNGGVASTPRACGGPVGTLIEVSQLFANTPVRRKFLKTVSTEVGHITEQFTRIALANPRLHMVLRHNQRVIHELPATERLLERLELIYGPEVTQSLIPVESELDGIRVWGFVAHPNQSKSTAKGQCLFLNGRWVTDRSLQHALLEAYRGLLMVGRYPVTFLFLEMPADQVDVNVHPTKAEVRFRDSQKLYRQMLSTVRSKFLSLGLNLDTSLRLGDEPSSASPADRLPPMSAIRQLSFSPASTNWSGDRAPFRPYPALPTPTPLPPLPVGEGRGEGALSGATHPHANPLPEGDGTRQPQSANAPSSGRAIQIHDSYLVVETDEGMTVIDQHALHERIMYEHLRERVLAGRVESQRMLLPEPVELSAVEAGLVVEQRETLAQLGLSVDEFGGNTVLVTSVPVMLSKASIVQLVRDIAERLATPGQNVTRRDLLDELLHMMSCKAAIKAGDRLTPEEIDSLLAQRHLIQDAHHCPHGRPTALTMSRLELDRQFGRLG